MRNRIQDRSLDYQANDSLHFSVECLVEEAGSVDHDQESEGVGLSIWRCLRRRSHQTHRSPTYYNVFTRRPVQNAGQNFKGRSLTQGCSLHFVSYWLKIFLLVYVLRCLGSCLSCYSLGSQPNRARNFVMKELSRMLKV